MTADYFEGQLAIIETRNTDWFDDRKDSWTEDIATAKETCLDCLDNAFATVESFDTRLPSDFLHRIWPVVANCKSVRPIFFSSGKRKLC